MAKDNDKQPEESNAPREEISAEKAAESEPLSAEEAGVESGAGGVAEGGGEAPAMSQEEIDEGKAFAILSYALSFISLPFFIVPLIMRNNDFALYHAKQCLMIWIIGFVSSAAGSVLLVVCIGPIIWIAAAVFLLIVNIIGLMNAVKGETVPLPLIGQYAEDWFKGISKL